MPSLLHSLARHVRTLSRSRTLTFAPQQRAFHSPFAALATNSARSPPASNSAAPHPPYEKQADHSPDPKRSHSGTHTYVVSPPDPEHVPYSVPSGAYPVDAPYPAFDKPAGSVGAAYESPIKGARVT